ncbi:hypothetical protein EYF80_057427 [Liparis tanakae]|uniref:Uncharacterized protein n=1 Tax=Liparis tanakae TaxID=230148 RepID=A0A4Z2EV43_9TELE|nr:hypothetical protein EYF80_057427 [Liparis tanakae]
MNNGFHLEDESLVSRHSTCSGPPQTPWEEKVLYSHHRGDHDEADLKVLMLLKGRKQDLESCVQTTSSIKNYPEIMTGARCCILRTAVIIM